MNGTNAPPVSKRTRSGSVGRRANGTGGIYKSNSTAPNAYANLRAGTAAPEEPVQELPINLKSRFKRRGSIGRMANGTGGIYQSNSTAPNAYANLRSGRPVENENPNTELNANPGCFGRLCKRVGKMFTRGGKLRKNKGKKLNMTRRK